MLNENQLALVEAIEADAEARGWREPTDEPDYMVTYREFWAEIVEQDGVLDLDRVARELHDYRTVMREASKVYEELSGLSKPNTAARHILDAAERKYAETYADMACDRAHTCDGDGQHEAAAALRELAEEWHEGSVNAYQDGRDRVAKIRAARAAAATPSTGEAKP